eukprot:gene4715-8299_t
MKRSRSDTTDEKIHGTGWIYFCVSGHHSNSFNTSKKICEECLDEGLDKKKATLQLQCPNCPKVYSVKSEKYVPSHECPKKKHRTLVFETLKYLDTRINGLEEKMELLIKKYESTNIVQNQQEIEKGSKENEQENQVVINSPFTEQLLSGMSGNIKESSNCFDFEIQEPSDDDDRLGLFDIAYRYQNLNFEDDFRPCDAVSVENDKISKELNGKKEISVVTYRPRECVDDSKEYAKGEYVAKLGKVPLNVEGSWEVGDEVMLCSDGKLRKKQLYHFFHETIFILTGETTVKEIDEAGNIVHVRKPTVVIPRILPDDKRKIFCSNVIVGVLVFLITSLLMFVSVFWLYSSNFERLKQNDVLLQEYIEVDKTIRQKWMNCFQAKNGGSFYDCMKYHFRHDNFKKDLLYAQIGKPWMDKSGNYCFYDVKPTADNYMNETHPDYFRGAYQYRKFLFEIQDIFFHYCNAHWNGWERWTGVMNPLVQIVFNTTASQKRNVYFNTPITFSKRAIALMDSRYKSTLIKFDEASAQIRFFTLSFLLDLRDLMDLRKSELSTENQKTMMITFTGVGILLVFMLVFIRTITFYSLSTIFFVLYSTIFQIFSCRLPLRKKRKDLEQLLVNDGDGGLSNIKIY